MKISQLIAVLQKKAGETGVDLDVKFTTREEGSGPDGSDSIDIVSVCTMMKETKKGDKPLYLLLCDDLTAEALG